MEAEIFIDPEEDEVFFAPVATQAQLEAIKKRRNRKTMVLRLTQEDKENVSGNIPNTQTPIKKNASYRDVIDDDEEQESIHNTTPFDPDDEEPVIEQLIDVSVADFAASVGNRRKTNILDWPADTPNLKALTPIRRGVNDFDDIDCSDEDNDLDSLFKDCEINESLVSWASVDVNAQLESLVANMENLLDDEKGMFFFFNIYIIIFGFLSDDADFNGSFLYSTPQKSEKSLGMLTTPKMALKADNDGGYLSALSEAAVAVSSVVPSLIVTEPTPDRDEKSPGLSIPSQNKIRRPLKLVYRDDKKSSSSSSGSFKSCSTPFQSTPFLKPSSK